MLQAKDTVLKIKWMNSDVQEDQDRLLLDQAENTWGIAFKAGRESGKYSISTVVDVGNDAFKDGHKAGVKEVVELLMTTVDYECEDENGSPTITFWFSPDEWQAKLKDWGIRLSNSKEG